MGSSSKRLPGAVGWASLPGAPAAPSRLVALKIIAGDLAGCAAGSVTTDAGTYRPVRVSHVAKDNGNTIDVIVFRASPSWRPVTRFSSMPSR